MKFKVCGLVVKDFGGQIANLLPVIKVTLSAISELVHWQNRDYALITPMITNTKVATEAIGESSKYSPSTGHRMLKC